MLSVVSLSFVVGSLAVVVKGTAAEILHHLLLTIRRGKSPIRLRKVKLVALGSFEADGQFFWRRADARLSSAAGATGLLFARSVWLPLGPARLRSLDNCSFPSVLPVELRVHPSARSSGCQITERGKRKKPPPHPGERTAARKTASPSVGGDVR